MTTESILITPQIAEQMLGKNTNNRNVRRAKVLEYANEMNAGRWHETGQPIIFFEDGTMADGQHRLLAIIESGIPAKMQVVKGISKDAMAGIDIGAKRTVADLMHLHHGLKSATQQCAAVKAIFSICFSYQNHPIQVGLMKTGIDTFGEELTICLAESEGFPPCRKAWIIGAMAFALKAHPELLDFIHKLTTGEDVKRGNPALTLRNWFISSTSLHLQKSYKAGAYQCVFNAMFAAVEERSITTLKSGETGINYFRQKNSSFTESVREEIQRMNKR